MTARQPSPYRLEIAHFSVAIGAFALGACMAVMQALSIAGLHVPGRSEKMYYISVTAHGVLMALVFTTFFIMGLGYLIIRRCLVSGGKIRGEGVAWGGFWTAVIGTAIAAVMILSGTSTVLYTFYPPLKAHPLFYIGATLLIIGSWIWGGLMVANYRVWRRENPTTPVPLPFHGMLATVIIWFLATAGLAAEVVGMLIPWSLGWVETVDPILARTYFWWFGHPLTYFWLVPAYVLWYTVMPKVAGGRLFSDPLTRMVFTLFIVLSTPVGFHHQFMDPGIESSWKLVHTFSTYAILYPSLVTAFTVIASMEVAGRMKGARGLFNWLGKLPWGDPFFSGVALAMVTFAVGGFGGAINAAYAMNAMIHNTAWIHGHFHLTVGTAVALTFMGSVYWMWPRLLGRELKFPMLARIQPYLWFVGMILFGGVNHITGLLGLPRRVYAADYLGSEIAARWMPLVKVAAFGGTLLFISALLFVFVVVTTSIWGRRLDVVPVFEFAEPLNPPPSTSGIWDRFGMWTVVAAVMIVVAYAYPIYHLLSQDRFGSLGFQPF